MPTPTFILGSVGSSSGTVLERSFSSSSLRASPSKASPGRVPQKSFSRQPARVTAEPASPVASASVAAHADSSSSLTLSLNDTEFATGLRQAISRDLPTIEAEVDHEQERAELLTNIEVLRQALQDLRDASSKNDESWQRENTRLKEQLAAAGTREVSQQEQLQVRDDQLALCRQELRELQDHQLRAEEEQAAIIRPPADEAGSSGLEQERELLKLVVQLVGASNVRTVLRESPSASPAKLREALIRLRCPQCRRLSPSSRTSSPAKSMGSGQTESLHKMLFGASSRPPSPTASASTQWGLDPHSSRK